ncbi:hypothetical protein D9619_006580 [Psilocybe cf. subviscida]|uniref:Uncharacterized protein n=1 Tax=Psilocybe cf. subviscida TaxID=2480587 RepID=A0A8H5B3I1_9AGAR|nr:hypothetical protein D9619_006580 [Psilocybe cf. subviscida]
MVVNRKQPVAPLQPISRSSSTQVLPTKRQVPPKNTTQNGVHDTDAKASNKKAVSKASKHKSKPKHRPKTFLDRVFILSLSLFAFYAVYTCRPNPIFSTATYTDLIHPNPVCRSLSVYNNHVLQPYIIPTVKHGLQITQEITEPYVQATKVKIEPYVAPVVRAAKTVEPYVIHATRTAKRTWKNTLIPFYTGTLLPYYKTAVHPRYQLYIKPRLDPLAAQASRYFAIYVSRPLHIQSTRLQITIHQYVHEHIQPHLNKVKPHLIGAYVATHATLVQGVDAYNVHLQPHVSTAWSQAKPLLCTAWKYTKRFSVKAAEIAAVQLKFLLREAGIYRRAYVDPHVTKIWAKVSESATVIAPKETITTSASPSHTTAATEPETVASIDEPIPAASTPLTTVPVVETAEPTTAETIQEEPTVGTPAPAEAAEDVPPVDTAVTSPTQEIVLETATQSTDAPEPAITNAPQPEPTPEAIVAESVLVDEPVTQESQVTPTPKADAAEEAMKAAESIIHESLLGSGNGEDLDDFLKELGLDSEAEASFSKTAAAEATPVVEEAPKLTPEEIAAKIAAKRAAIVTRHDNWFVKLEDAIAEESDEVYKTIEEWRNKKTTELRQMSHKNAKDAGLVNEVQKEGERLVKGLEAYLRRAIIRSAAWKVAADATKEDKDAKKKAAQAEKDKWQMALSKVEAKFSERVVALQKEVHTWFVAERQQEIDDIQYSAAKIKAVAERAQADLGLDYAWLEDTSYDDWQYYHDLMRASEDFEQTAYALQNGTVLPDVRPPIPDPIVPALDTLHNDLQDVVAGFQVALGSVRGESSKVFSIFPAESDEDEDGFFVIKDGQVRKDDLRGVDMGGLGLTKEKEGVVGGVKLTSEDEVKILPIIPDGTVDTENGQSVDASKIIIGKDAVQIEQALSDIPLEPAASRHEEL